MRPLLPLLLLALPAPVAAQAPLPVLAFFGFEAGTHLDAADARVQALGGRGLKCDQSRRDRAVRDCRASMKAPGSGKPMELWLSAVDSAASVLTVSSRLTGAEFGEWKGALEKAYGVVDARVQGSQWMLQWVRQGRMIRLTWRVERGVNVTSVSLVDGHVLDTWGKSRHD